MNKNRVSIILFGFMGCLLVTIIILVVKLSLRPEEAISDIAGTTEKEPEVIIQEGDINDVLPPDDTTPEDDIASTDPAVPQTQTVVKKYVKLTDENIASGNNVNIRSEANTSCTILGKLTKDDQAEYVENVNDKWVAILYDGVTAYVSASYVQLIEVEEQVPVTDDDAPVTGADNE